MNLDSLKKLVFFGYCSICCLDCRPRTIVSTPKAEPYARKILGEGQDFHPAVVDPVVMRNSFLARRKEGWRIAKEALRSVDTRLAVGSGPDQARSLPLFQSWYDSSEFKDMVRYLYKCQMTAEQRLAVKMSPPTFTVPPEMVAKTLATHTKRKLPSTWTSERFRLVLDQLRNKNDLAGLNGVEGTGVSLFSPALLKHYLTNLSFVLSCEKPATGGPAPDEFAGCFSKTFPPESVAVKTTLNRLTTGAARFDTQAGALSGILTNETPSKAHSWSSQSPPTETFTATGALDRIFNVEFHQAEQDYGAFVLTGLHVTTKEIPQWMWVTLWWSDSPGSDFGEDRPADFLTGLDPRFANYKMCVVTDFDEGDPLITNSSQGPSNVPYPSLIAAARASYAATKPHSWCSNPFIEHMPHGAKSNCIGCHQFAGTAGIPVIDNTHPPHLEKSISRFTGDFLASFHGGIRDDFQGTIQEAISSIDQEGDELEMAECQLEQDPI